MPADRPLTAAARTLEPGTDEADRHLAKLREDFQAQSFVFYDTIGELRNAGRFISNSLSRLRLYPAVQLEPDQPPVRLDRDDLPEGVTPEEADLAHETLARLRSPESDQGQLIADAAMQLFLPGEGYLCGRIDAEVGERWDVYSIQELVWKNDMWVLDRGPRDPVPFDGKDPIVARFWQAHPSKKWKADSAIRSLIVECSELDLLTRAIHGQAMSQLNAGVFIYPTEASFGPAEVTSPDDTGEVVAVDNFDADIEDYFAAAIENPASAASVTPIFMRLAADLVDKPRHLSLARPFDAIAQTLRAELIIRLANGLELPAEALTGRKELNHFTGWIVTDETFRNYLMPKANAVVGAFTAHFLRPQLELQGVENVGRFLVWYDEAALVTHPNQSHDVKDVFDRGGASWEALRRATNLNDSDAPDETELVERQRLGLLGATKAGSAGGVQDSSDTESQVVNPQAGGSTPGEGQRPQALPVGGTSHRGPVVFQSNRATRRADKQLAQLGTAMFRINRQITDQLQTSADLAIRRAVERAGARVTSKIRHDHAYKATVADVGLGDVCSRLGFAAVTGKLDLSSEDLIDDQAFTDLAQIWSTKVGRAQSAILEKISRFDAFGPTKGIGEAWTYRAEADRADGWSFFHTQVLARGRDVLWGDTPIVAGAAVAPIVTRMRRQEALDREAVKRRAAEIAEQLGERDSQLTLPPSVVREALALAGGAKGPSTSGGMIADPSGPVTGLTDGPLVDETLAENGIGVAGLEWVTGEPDRPFEPHAVLDGVELSGWDDEQLITEGEDWLIDPDTGGGLDFYRPGDHVGCVCAVVQMFSGDLAEPVTASAVHVPATLSTDQGGTT